MSRAKIAFINRDKVISALVEKNISQKELAEQIGMNRQALNRALKSGRISETLLDRIGLQLDLAPEYLSDNPGIIDGAPINYALHLAQDKQRSWAAIISSVWIRNGYTPSEIDLKDFWGLYDAIQPAIDKYIEAYRTKTKEKQRKTRI